MAAEQPTRTQARPTRSILAFLIDAFFVVTLGNDAAFLATWLIARVLSPGSGTGETLFFLLPITVIAEPLAILVVLVLYRTASRRFLGATPGRLMLGLPMQPAALSPSALSAFRVVLWLVLIVQAAFIGVALFRQEWRVLTDPAIRDEPRVPLFPDGY